MTKAEREHRDQLRQLAYNRIQSADIPRRPCEICGAEPAHMHHPDYAKPLDVVFLCPSHHRRLHVAERRQREAKKSLDVPLHVQFTGVRLGGLRGVMLMQGRTAQDIVYEALDAWLGDQSKNPHVRKALRAHGWRAGKRGPS